MGSVENEESWSGEIFKPMKNLNTSMQIKKTWCSNLCYNPCSGKVENDVKDLLAYQSGQITDLDSE